MAVINVTEMDSIRWECNKAGVPIPLTKSAMNGAIQAVEDWFETNRPTLSAAIDAATAPATITAAQKKRLIGNWMRYKLAREV